jgi:tRNA dimethylallyltransferase
MGMPQLVVITGPTASGKTALAIELASHYQAEIVSADSRQVYRHLDIGTAKPTPAQQARIPHHLIDIIDPAESFDAARFRQRAIRAIQDIFGRGKQVFVVGGTGLYVRALTRGLFAGPAADTAVRARLQQQENQEGRGFLHRQLQHVDPESAARLHPNDTVRLIRALEVFQLSGTPMSQWQREHRFQERPFDTLTIGLAVERATLYERIEQRCRVMLKEGLVEELRRIWALGYSPELPVLQTIGYAQVARLLGGQYTAEEALEQMTQATRRLAKRQLTWFRAEPEVSWFAPTQLMQMRQALDQFFASPKGNRHADKLLRF